MNKVGRPTLLTDALKQQIIKMYELSLTDEQVAYASGISKRALNNWKKDPEFMHSLKEAKELADDAVEASLFRRATGYSAKAVKIFCDKNGNIITHEYVEHFSPDTTAMIFWLKNRKPKEWRDKIDAEINSSTEIKITIDKQDSEL